MDGTQGLWLSAGLCAKCCLIVHSGPFRRHQELPANASFLGIPTAAAMQAATLWWRTKRTASL